MQFTTISQAKEEKKFENKMKKQMRDSIVFGVPNTKQYQYLPCRLPLSSIPVATLQNHVNNIKAKYCTGDIVILNTNLKEMGVNI